jgi:hypothetical protein
MRTVKASEIGSFLFCQRSWSYQKQGFEPENRAALNAGSEYHASGGKKVAAAVLLKWGAWIALLAAVVLLAVGGILLIFQ